MGSEQTGNMDGKTGRAIEAYEKDQRALKLYNDINTTRIYLRLYKQEVCC